MKWKLTHLREAQRRRWRLARAASIDQVMGSAHAVGPLRGIGRGADRCRRGGRGFVRIVGPDRGYLIWQTGRVYWRARIHALQIRGHLPPQPWVDRLITHDTGCSGLFPLHAVVFSDGCGGSSGEGADANNDRADVVGWQRGWLRGRCCDLMRLGDA